jgi:hypothetical protein
MMMDNLRTGRSERQFALLVGLFGVPIDLYLGGIQRAGEFLEDLGEIGECPPGGSFLTLQTSHFSNRLVELLRRTRDKVAHSISFLSDQ